MCSCTEWLISILTSLFFKVILFADKHPEGFIAMLALFLTMYQGYETRKHNRLSVRPKLSLLITDGLGPESSGRDVIYKVTLRSVGLGPAIIKSVVILHEGEKFDGTTASGMEAFISKLRNQIETKLSKPRIGKNGHDALNEGYCMNIGDENDILIFKLSGVESEPLVLEECRSFFAKTKSIVEFESMYGLKDSDISDW